MVLELRRVPSEIIYYFLLPSAKLTDERFCLLIAMITYDRFFCQLLLSFVITSGAILNDLWTIK